MTTAENVYTDPKTSPRESPVKDAATTARGIGASVTGLINLAGAAGLITAGVTGNLNLAVGLIVGAIVTAVPVVGQLWQAAKIVRDSWSKVTPIDKPRVLDAAGRLVALIPERPLDGPGARDTQPHRQ